MFLVQYASHYLTCILFFYYTSHVLTPKWSAKKTLFLSLIYYAISMLIIDFFFPFSLLKPFLGILNIFINSILVFQGSVWKKLKYSMITVAISITSEIIYVFLNLVFFNNFYIGNTIHEFFLSIVMCHSILFILFYVTIHKPFKALYYPSKVSLTLLVYFFITSMTVSNLYDINATNCTFGHSDAYHKMVHDLAFFTILIIPILIIVIILALIKMEKEIMEKTLYQEIYHEYEKHLTALYSQDRMDAYIRHDLINYIETYQRLQNNKNS